jgi:hypothetical protein
MFYVARTATGLTVKVIYNFDNGLLGASYNGTSKTTSNITLSTVVGGPLSISVAVDKSDNLYVAYTATDTTIRMVKLALTGSTYSKVSEEAVVSSGSGWSFGLLDIDVSDNTSGTAVAIVAYRYTLGTTMYAAVSVKDTSGAWTSSPKLIAVDVYNSNTRTNSPNFIGGPLAITFGDNFASGTISMIHVLSRGANYGSFALYQTSCDVTSAASLAGRSATRVAYNFAQDSRSWRDAYGSIFHGSATGTAADPIMVAVGSRGILYFGEFDGVQSGDWSIPVSSNSQVAKGTWPSTIWASRSPHYDVDLRYIGVVGGPDRVTFLCARDNGAQAVLVPVTANIKRNNPAAGTVQWHTGSGDDYCTTGTTYDDTAWRISQVYDGVNRNTSIPVAGSDPIGRLTFFCNHWILFGSEAYHPYFGVARKPGRLSASYESGAPTYPAQSATIDTSLPVPTAQDNSAPGARSAYAPLLDRAAEFQFSSAADFSTIISETPDSFSKMVTTPTSVLVAAGAVSPKLPQGAVYGRYRTVDAHGLPSDWAPLVPAPPDDGSVYSHFTVAHPPDAAVTAPKDLAPVSSAIAAPLLSWEFHDTSPGDSQTAYQVIVQKQSDGSAIIDTGKVTSTSKVYAAAGMTANSDIKQWKVRVWDADDVVGDYSDWATFYYVSAPEFLTSTVDATTPLPTFNWSYDPAAGYGGPVKYMVWVFDDESNMILNTGDILSTATSGSYSATTPILDIDRSYSAVFITWDTLGSSGLAGPVAFDTNAWARPATVTGVAVDASVLATSGYVSISWSTTAQDPDFTKYTLYRYVTIAGVDGPLEEVGSTILGAPTPTITLVDVTPPLVGTVTYVVKQSSNFYGVQIESDPGYAAPQAFTEDSYWLVEPAAQGVTPSEVAAGGLVILKLWHVTSDTFSEEYEEELLSLIGRGRRKEIGTRFGYTGQLELALNGAGGDDPHAERLALESIRANKNEMILRTPFGDAIKVSLGAPQYERIAGTGTIERTKVTIPYEEVA